MRLKGIVVIMMPCFILLGGWPNIVWDKKNQQEASTMGSQQTLTSKQEPAAQSTGTVSGTPKEEDQNIKIYFKHNSNDLTPEAVQKLNEVAEYMSANLNVAAVVRGYTDSLGDYKYNVVVADFRASTVKMYLVGKGIAVSRITAVGIGPKDFIASNDTFEGRARNRRVEIEYRKRPAE